MAKAVHGDDSDMWEAGEGKDHVPEYAPKTSLGRRLWAIRERIVASGEPLLDWDDIDREIAERRGGAAEE